MDVSTGMNKRCMQLDVPEKYNLVFSENINATYNNYCREGVSGQTLLFLNRGYIGRLYKFGKLEINWK